MTATTDRPDTRAVTTAGSRAPRSGPPRTRGWIARRGLLYATLVALLLVFVFPLLWALSGSFKQRGDIFATPPTLIPSPATGRTTRTCSPPSRSGPGSASVWAPP